MKEELKKVELVELDTMYESLRCSEFDPENGVGELVDNSVESGANIINVGVVSKCNSSDQQKKGSRKNKVDMIWVADDGAGMEKEILWESLVLGKSNRLVSRVKIGKFGVGLILGAISIGRCIEIFSRTNAENEFLYTYIDLDEIKDKENPMRWAPEPVIKKLPSEFRELFDGKKGTLVIISRCDRINDDASVVSAGISSYLGRTYRKFIEGGLEIRFNGNKVYLQDPLYLSGPTFFDTKGQLDPKAELIDQESIPLPIPGKEGETAKIDITLSLLPKEWRSYQGQGISPDLKRRKVDQNEGVSILRANREVFYGKIPYLIGAKGQSSYENKDRFWGCEISFPPELDEYFQVRYIKRGVEPVTSLREKLREILTAAIDDLRKRITSDWSKETAEKGKNKGTFGNAEAVVNKTEIAGTMKSTTIGSSMSEDDEDALVEEVVSRIPSEKTGDEERKLEQNERKKAIKSKPLSLVPVSYPASILFEPVYLMNHKIVININVSHPFYQEFIVPLCGDLEKDTDDLSVEKMKMRDAIFLLFCSYARASAMYDSEAAQDVLTNHLSDIGTFLATFTKEYRKEIKND